MAISRGCYYKQMREKENRNQVGIIEHIQGGKFPKEEGQRPKPSCLRNCQQN